MLLSNENKDTIKYDFDEIDDLKEKVQNTHNDIISKSGDLEKAIIDYNKSVVDNNLKLSTKFDNESKTITENIKAGSKTIDDNLINIKNYIQKK